MSELSEKITALTINYLGPASQKFLERQTKAHMNGIEFSNVTKENLTELAKWVNTSAALLIDKGKALELSNKIAEL